MTHTGQWKVDVFLFDNDSEVTAEAVLHADTARPVVGRGSARIPATGDIPEVSTELAASRALAALGTRLLEITAEDLRALAEPAPGSYDSAGRTDRG